MTGPCGSHKRRAISAATFDSRRTPALLDRGRDAGQSVPNFLCVTRTMQLELQQLQQLPNRASR